MKYRQNCYENQVIRGAAFLIFQHLFLYSHRMITRPHITQSRLKLFQKLTQKKYRNEEKKFLIEGVHLVDEVLNSDWDIECLLICSSVLKDTAENIGRRAKNRGVEICELSERELNKLSDTVTSQGIVGVVAQPNAGPNDFWKKLPKKSLIVAMDNISDPGNTGTILRTSDWFGAYGVVMSNDTAEVFNPKVLRASMGAIFHLSLLQDVDLEPVLEEATRNGFSIIATALQNGISLSSFSFPERSLVIFGNESSGVSHKIRSLSDTIITIPKFGKAESLNVGVACGVILGSARL